MLWVWPTPLAAGETPPSRDLIPGFPGEEGDTPGHQGWMMRDFENDYPLLLENILDPDHAEFVHASPLIFKDFTFLPDQPRRQITKKFFPVQGKPTIHHHQQPFRGMQRPEPWKAPPNAAATPALHSFVASILRALMMTEICAAFANEGEIPYYSVSRLFGCCRWVQHPLGDSLSGGIFPGL